LSRTASQRSNVARSRHTLPPSLTRSHRQSPLCSWVHLIIAGLFTRAAAFVLAGEMAVAYFQMHAPKGFWPILNGGELAVLYCFTFLFMAAAGGGRWSLDALIDRGRRSRPPTVEAEPQPTRRWAA